VKLELSREASAIALIEDISGIDRRVPLDWTEFANEIVFPTIAQAVVDVVRKAAISPRLARHLQRLSPNLITLIR
jgi:hypothetical protein